MGKSDSVVLLKDKIYTSYFSHANKIVPNRRLVSISLGTPDNWGGSFYRELNPPISLLKQYKSGEVSVKEYREVYRETILSQLKPSKVYNDLKGKVLCCWEKSESFCHRHLVLEWLVENLGNEVAGGEI